MTWLGMMVIPVVAAAVVFRNVRRFEEE